MIDIDLLTVLIAALAYMVIGGFWYSDLLFGAIWRKLVKTEKRKPKGVQFLGSFLVAFIIAFFLALIQAFLGVSTTVDGIYVGLVIWLGFVATTQFSAVIWAKKPVKLYLLDAGWTFLGFGVVGGIIGA